MKNYTITLKNTVPRELPILISVTPDMAARIKKSWDAKQNCYVGDEYVSWTRIEAITSPVEQSSTAVTAGPRYCGQCEKGWVYTSRGVTACFSCSSESVRQMVRDYGRYLLDHEFTMADTHEYPVPQYARTNSLS